MSGPAASYDGGYAGRVLVVDLTRRTVEPQVLDPGLARKFVGSRGLNSWLLVDQMVPGADPFGPDNVLVFGAGPLTGTGFPTSARYTVSARSPLTGLLGDSNSGGYFGPELKRAGWDHVVLRGRADRPVVLWIRDDQVALRDADDLWGLDTWETTDALARQAGGPKIRVACIGPAGERLVRYAAIINERHRAAGRSGMGAVMGAKRLKAIAVRGTGRVRLADSAAFRATARRASQQIQADPGFAARSEHGTASLMALLSYLGTDSTRNSQAGHFEGHEAIGADALAERYWLERTGCAACPIRCSHAYRVTEGPYAGTSGEGPEYETLNALGSKLGIDDLAAILHANSLANRYGLDTMSLGTTIAFAMECYEAGLLSREEADGLELTWGNHKTMVALTHCIARREGLGDLLAEGSRRAARALGRGAERYAMHVKGMELPASDPRGSLAAALSYAVSSRGGDHLRAGFVKVAKKWRPEDALRLVGTADAVDAANPAGKAALVRWEEDLCAVADSLGVCLFICSSLLAVTMGDFAAALSQVTGWDVDEGELWRVGQRVTTLERAYNLLHGLRPEDDGLPARFLEQPLADGPAAGRKVVDLARMVADYYAARGWGAGGVPEPSELRALGLERLVDDLWREGVRAA